MIEFAAVLQWFTILYRATFDTDVVLLLLLDGGLVVYKISIQRLLRHHAIVWRCRASLRWAVVLLCYGLLDWSVWVLAQRCCC